MRTLRRTGKFAGFLVAVSALVLIGSNSFHYEELCYPVHKGRIKQLRSGGVLKDVTSSSMVFVLQFHVMCACYFLAMQEIRSKHGSVVATNRQVVIADVFFHSSRNDRSFRPGASARAETSK